jgi:hypothetical protein
MKKFIIYSPEYSENTGGIIALHKLAALLSIENTVYITSSRTIPQSNSNLINYSTAKLLIDLEGSNVNDQHIVIYPEIIKGNPLGAKKVIRWILYHPGIHGGDTTFDENELIFTYSKYFVKDTIYETAPILFTFDSKSDIFFNKNQNRRYNSFLIKKGNHKYSPYEPVYGGLIDGICLDKILNSPNLNQDLNEIFNNSYYFISYDSATYHSVQAAMSGCISIVVPDLGVSKEDWIEKFPLMKYGVAWGIEDIEWAENTKHLVKDHLKDLENYATLTINDLLKILE